MQGPRGQESGMARLQGHVHGEGWRTGGRRQAGGAVVTDKHKRDSAK